MCLGLRAYILSVIGAALSHRGSLSSLSGLFLSVCAILVAPRLSRAIFYCVWPLEVSIPFLISSLGICIVLLIVPCPLQMGNGWPMLMPLAILVPLLVMLSLVCHLCGSALSLIIIMINSFCFLSKYGLCCCTSFWSDRSRCIICHLLDYIDYRWWLCLGRGLYGSEKLCAKLYNLLHTLLGFLLPCFIVIL